MKVPTSVSSMSLFTRPTCDARSTITPNRLNWDQSLLDGHTLKKQNSGMQMWRQSAFLERTFERRVAEMIPWQLSAAIYPIFPRQCRFDACCSNCRLFRSRSASYDITWHHLHVYRLSVTFHISWQAREPKWHDVSDLKLIGANIPSAPFGLHGRPIDSLQDVQPKQQNLLLSL